MLPLLFTVMLWVINIFPWVMIAGWLIGMADPAGNWTATRILSAITLPFLRMTSGMVPRIGQLDLSPFLVFLLSYVVGFLLRALYYA